MVEQGFDEVPKQGLSCLHPFFFIVGVTWLIDAGRRLYQLSLFFSRWQ